MKTKIKNKGSLLIEIIIATTIFILLAGTILHLLIQTRESQYNTYLHNQAGQLLQEGIEALIAIKGITATSGAWEDQSGFSTFTPGIHYLTKDSSENWFLTNTPETIDTIFNRKIIIEDVLRLDDGKGDIDASGTGETLLPSGVVTKKATVEITWQDLNQKI